ncbi:hypothetical protein [Phormidium sp. CCY1219]|jgi:hypothetical protein|uniref:hypothetical protein n=1 Tax=Phormidium sp. CCY1219 TaxID=2886104 RepID=UPI002D1EC191|nr:hypothetical protein [Phormidium sp. CCY1219]MEB3826875.1 hypothetical protein [Phormidium sp. CCY1219]
MGEPLPNDVLIASNQMPSDLIPILGDRLLENQQQLLNALSVASRNKKYRLLRFRDRTIPR